MTSFIRCVAEELDFILCLGHYCRSIDSIDGSISHVIDMDGEHVIGSQSLYPIGDQAIGEALPDNPLSCTVMVLFRAKQMYDITFSSNTIQEMFQGLVSISDRPAKKVKSMAMYIITILEYDEFISLDVLVLMIEFALTRLDIELWTEAVNVSLASTYPDLLCRKAVLLRSLQVFGFEKVRSRFERLLDFALFGNLYHFLRKIPSNLAIGDDADAINLWCNERLRLNLRSFGVDRHRYVPLLIHMAHKHGIHYLLEIRPSRGIEVPFLFADKFIRALQRKKRGILKANVQFDTVRATAILEGQGCKTSVLSSEHAIDILVDRWLSEAIGDLLTRLGQKTGCFDYHSDLIGEYFDLLSWHDAHEHLIAESLKFIKLCIIAGHVERCGTILDAIEGLDGHEPTKLELCIVPLVWDLGPLLQAKHTLSPPFAPFFRRVIECHVRCFLGTRTRNPQEMFLRQKINKRFLCACKTCTEVKEFLHQLYVPRRYFSGSKAALRHIECNTTVIYELVDIKLVDRPRIALQITKHEDIFEMQRWENRVEDLQDLLSDIGSERIVERVMGDRYADLKVAMEGKGEYRDSL
ncbi:hypothetical protein M378DRAFT_11281 [Amanita muscaria Koide BX008]|uniref:Uncharacterized protein n=1 Tax=Amanita muscaria (strain Koide BX008) TaxID=946122 RepID=A0A0C2SNB2_AMAMK|nr:hypothetical protein M378DRAFT_11281 [Amanita muscaria Koide BX008]